MIRRVLIAKEAFKVISACSPKGYTWGSLARIHMMDKRVICAIHSHRKPFILYYNDLFCGG